jgi:hypothetical protein
VQQAGAIYRHVDEKRGGREFITEVSMDETDAPQTPPELLVILAAIADEKIPVQTIAPKFTGRFNKGVDYVGDVVQFEKEFSEDLAVIAFAGPPVRPAGQPQAERAFGQRQVLDLRPIRRALERFGAGVHLKTAGTTWLEELIGLAEAGGEGLDLAKQVYAKAFENRDALCEPYATVIDIDYAKLPDPAVVNGWSFRTVHFGAASRPEESGFQSGPAPTAARGLQGGRQDGRQVPQDAGDLRGPAFPATSPRTFSSGTSSRSIVSSMARAATIPRPQPTRSASSSTFPSRPSVRCSTSTSWARCFPARRSER